VLLGLHQHFALGKSLQIESDREQVDVCQRQLVTYEMAGLGERFVEYGKLLFHVRQGAIDHLPVRTAVSRARKDVADDVLAHAGGIDDGVDAADPLLGQGIARGVHRHQGGPLEGAVDVGADGFRLEELHVAVAHHRDLAEGVDGVDLARVGGHGRELVGHALLGGRDAHNPHIIALRGANDFQLGHD
jgi:hypothetical protein